MHLSCWRHWRRLVSFFASRMPVVWGKVGWWKSFKDISTATPTQWWGAQAAARVKRCYAWMATAETDETQHCFNWRRQMFGKWNINEQINAWHWHSSTFFFSFFFHFLGISVHNMMNELAAKACSEKSDQVRFFSRAFLFFVGNVFVPTLNLSFVSLPLTSFVDLEMGQNQITEFAENRNNICGPC